MSDTQFLPGEPGWSQSQSQLCGGNSTWGTEATYYWTDEKLVVFEPRTRQFDYSAFSDLNPFTGDGYSFRKANELYPDTSRATAAYEKLNYSQAALSAKPRAIESRRATSASDQCAFVPARWSDLDIAGGDGWLPPTPQPRGSTGTYTYSISSTMSAGHVAQVLAALATMDQLVDGSRQPRLVEWEVGSLEPPTLTFTDKDFERSGRMAEAQVVGMKRGRDGLNQWDYGNVSLSGSRAMITPITIVHEILHVYGFAHISFSSTDETMSAAFTSRARRTGWNLDSDATPANHKDVDACTKEAVAGAAAP